MYSNISSYYIYSDVKNCNSLDFPRLQPYGLSTSNRHAIDDRSQRFLKFNSRYGISIYRAVTDSRIVRPKASSNSPAPSSSPWKKWLIGVLLTVILPAVGHKGGLLLGLKAKIDNAIETVEHVTEVVEEIAEEADKIVDEVEKKLPGDSKLRETLESFDRLAERAVAEAKKAEDVVHKVRDVEQELEVALLKAKKDETTT